MNRLIRQLSLSFLLLLLCSCQAFRDKTPNILSSANTGKVQKPEDILPDNKETIQLTLGPKTLIARKGSLAAAFANARLQKDMNASEQDKALAFQWLKDNALVIAALMGDDVKFTDQRIQNLIDDERQKALSAQP